MNSRSSSSLPLSKTILGFIQYKAAEGLSPNTISSYEHDLNCGWSSPPSSPYTRSSRSRRTIISSGCAGRISRVGSPATTNFGLDPQSWQLLNRTLLKIYHLDRQGDESHSTMQSHNLILARLSNANHRPANLTWIA